VTLWLRSWHTSTHTQYIISVLGLLLLAVTAEGLAAMRARCVPLRLCAPLDPGLGSGLSRCGCFGSPANVALLEALDVAAARAVRS